MLELTANIIDGSPPIDDIAREYLSERQAELVSAQGNMTETEYKENMLCCMHAVNILRLLGFKDFMELYSNGPNNMTIDPNLINTYIDTHWDEITTITRLGRDKSENYVNKSAHKLFDKSFGMSYLSLKTGCYINVKTFKKVHGKIVLTTMDSQKIPPSRSSIIECFQRNILNSRNINAPQKRALVLNVIRDNKVI